MRRVIPVLSLSVTLPLGVGGRMSGAPGRASPVGRSWHDDRGQQGGRRGAGEGGRLGGGRRRGAPGPSRRRTPPSPSGTLGRGGPAGDGQDERPRRDDAARSALRRSRRARRRACPGESSPATAGSANRTVATTVPGGPRTSSSARRPGSTGVPAVIGTAVEAPTHGVGVGERAVGHDGDRAAARPGRPRWSARSRPSSGVGGDDAPRTVGGSGGRSAWTVAGGGEAEEDRGDERTACATARRARAEGERAPAVRERRRPAGEQVRVHGGRR